MTQRSPPRTLDLTDRRSRATPVSSCVGTTTVHADCVVIASDCPLEPSAAEEGGAMSQASSGRDAARFPSRDVPAVQAARICRAPLTALALAALSVPLWSPVPGSEGRARPAVSLASNPGPVVSQEHPVATAAFGSIQGDEFGPAIGFDGTNFLVVWEDFRSGTTSDIVGARVDRAGTILDATSIPVSTAPGSQFGPAVAFDGTNFLVAWKDFRSGPNIASVFAARVSRSGTVLDPAGIPISDNLDDVFGPALAFDGTNVLVVWQAFRFGAPTRIVAGRVSQSGAVLDPAGVSIAVISDNQFRPAVAFDGTNFLVVWTDSRSGPEMDIFGARVSRAGVVLDPAGIPISADPFDQEFDPALAFTGTDFLVVWAAFRNSPAMDIFGAAGGAAPESSRDPGGIPISTAPNDQFGPAVAPDGKDFLVVWGDRRASPRSEIVGAKVRADGVAPDPSGFLISAAPTAYSPPGITNDKHGKFWGVVYQQSVPEDLSNNVLLRVLKRH